MLVLTRKVLKPTNPEETIVLRDKTTGAILAKIGVLKANGASRVRLGVDADDNVEILRGESLATEEGYIHVAPQNQGLLKLEAGQGETKKSA